jgi:fatty acid synthase
MTAEGTQGTHALVDRLTAGETYAVAFGGQGGAWLETLEELVSSAGIESELATLVGEADLLLEPIAKELVVVRPIGFEPLRWVRALAAEDPVPSDRHLTSAAVSLPGVLLTQIAAIRTLARQGMDLHETPPVAVVGHSQGVLGLEALKAAGERDIELLALAQLIGAAGTLVARRRGISVLGDRPPMVSVSNADPERIYRLLEDFSQDVRTVLPPVLSIRNGRRSVVITGTPEQLSRFELYCKQISDKEEADRKNKVRGGDVFAPAFDPVQVEVGFHTPRLADGIDIVGDWAEKVGLDVGLARALAEAILVRPVDWVDEVVKVHEAGARWILDLGPGDILTRLTAPVIRGLGIGIVPAATRGGQRNLFTIGAVPEVARPWSSYAPSVVTLPDGRVKLSTKFTRLTGRSPILLAGMTPTTVDAKIVAAAANAGHWAELAGGGQVTEPIFNDRIHELSGLLDPGRTYQFNALFLDPYLWKLQVGGKRLVQKARQSGAPIDGLIVSAGIPELEEAVELIDELNEVGISHVVFKPGTVEQTRRRPPLLGRPRRSAAGHLFGIAVAAQHHGLRRWRYRYPRAGSRILVRALGRGLRLPVDARRRHPGRHRCDGDAGIHHVAVGQADAGRDAGHRPLDQRRKSPGRHGFQPQPARRRHPRDRQLCFALRAPARPGRRGRRSRRGAPRRDHHGDGRHRQAVLRRRRRDDLPAVVAALCRAGHRRRKQHGRHCRAGQPVAGRHLARPVRTDAATSRGATAPAGPRSDRHVVFQFG